MKGDYIVYRPEVKERCTRWVCGDALTHACACVCASESVSVQGPELTHRQRNPRQGRAGQGRAGQGRAGQGRAGQGRAGQGRAGQGRAGQGCGWKYLGQFHCLLYVFNNNIIRNFLCICLIHGGIYNATIIYDMKCLVAG